MATLMACSTVGMLSSRTHLSSSSRQPILPSLKTTSFADLGFVCSQLSGLQISSNESIKLKPICVPTKLPLQPVARLNGLDNSGVLSSDIYICCPYSWCLERSECLVLAENSRICPFTGKKANKANKVSHSNHKTKKLQFVNLQYKRIWWDAGNRFVKLRLSTKAIKTIERNGLDAVAKKAGIDLRKL